MPITRNNYQENNRYTTYIYIAMIFLLVADQMFSSFIGKSAIIRLLELSAFVSIFFFFIKLFLNQGLFIYRKWNLVLFILLFSVSTLIIVRGNYSVGAKTLLTGKLLNQTSILAYMMPIVIVLLCNRISFRSILNVFYYSMLIIIPIWITSVTNLVQADYKGEAIGSYLPYFGVVLILFRNKISRYKRWVVYSIYFIYLILMTLNARRNVMLSLSILFIVAFFYGNYSKIIHNKKVKAILFGSIILLGLLISINWNMLSNSIFKRVLDRGLEDTRSQVEMLFLMDMSSSPASEWIFGRGIDGTYFQMSQDEETMEFNTDRIVIETGYLNLILKGGILFVLVIILFLFTAVIDAFKTKQSLMKGIAFILLFYLIDMYMTNPVSFFSVKQIMFWFLVSTCMQYSQKINAR